jgi:hypothetical protein
MPLILSFFLAAGLACAQGRVEARATAGHAAFVDESFLHHFAAGGSVRFYVTRRLSFEPEFLYLRNTSRDQDWVVLPNVVFDLTRRDARVKPYVVGGVGMLWNRSLTGRGYYTSSEALVSGGLGAKIFLTERWFVAPEVRIGVEPFVRVTGSIGYVLRR